MKKQDKILVLLNGKPAPPEVEAAVFRKIGEMPAEPKEKFVLRLEHCPNPDIHDSNGYWQPPVTERKVTVEVSNLLDARGTFESWRDANGLGGGNMARHCGEIRRKNGQLVGRFSFNGRFWNPEGREVFL